MGCVIENLTVGRFRAIRELQLSGLGRVNLVTGRNNTGKSSLLEAMRILASDGAPYVISEILRSREENPGEQEDAARPMDTDVLFHWSSLFHGFPNFSAKLDPIVLVSSWRSRSTKLSFGVGWFTTESSDDGIRRLIPQEQDIFGDSNALPALVVESTTGRRVWPLEALRRSWFRGRSPRSDIDDESRWPCVFVSPYGGERTTTLGPLWDRIALSDREQDIVEALRIIDPNITAVSMVGGDGARQTRTAIVKVAGIHRPIPLRSFGDGLNRLFGIVLSLVNAKHGLLLIDEFDNGMHHSIQADAWRAIFRLAAQLDIQVVATSHSWDSVEAFQIAAA